MVGRARPAKSSRERVWVSSRARHRKRMSPCLRYRVTCLLSRAPGPQPVACNFTLCGGAGLSSRNRWTAFRRLPATPRSPVTPDSDPCSSLLTASLMPFTRYQSVFVPILFSGCRAECRFRMRSTRANPARRSWLIRFDLYSPFGTNDDAAEIFALGTYEREGTLT